ncbi:GHKL domain-containing protein [Tissierella sp. MSJ-40]|uniref:GHKL domain-containing protein n=1 Tax=Tissierella simiarum TaxID=2841534 RepID=A0ABS6E7A8_9FIRM|nr:GHKL domain-containing protein [Tissierella simiarum]MBU5438795.1 GHKL domain-containing protein [Tissierella simiarum]
MPKPLIWSIYEYMLCLVEVFLLYDFLEFVLNRNKKVKDRIYYLSIFILSTFIFILTEIKIYSILRTTLVYIVFLIVAKKLFNGNIKSKITYVTIFYFFLVFGDLLSVNIVSYFTDRNIYDTVVDQTWARLFLSQLSKFLLLLFLRFIKNSFKEKDLNIPKYYWHWILFVYLISGVNLLILFRIGLITSSISLEIQYLIISISMGSLSIVLITYYVFIKLNEFYKERSNYKIMEIKNEMLTKEIEEKEKIYESIRRTHHDFKNHIICIDKLLEQNKLDTMKEYIDNLRDEAIQTYTWIKSGNHVIDTILNQKKSEGNKKNIDMDIKVSIPENINIRPLDLCSILGNALDNGIEANEKIEDMNKRKIRIKINPYKDYLFIEISNPTITNPINEQGQLETTKRDKENHGFGVKSIETVVERYNGILNYEYNNEEFILSIMLPII